MNHIPPYIYVLFIIVMLLSTLPNIFLNKKKRSKREKITPTIQDYKNRNEQKGAEAEAEVNRVLKTVIQNKTCDESMHLLSDLTLLCHDGTTQIDHILITRYGLFIIETKCYSGWIFGRAKDPMWTQQLNKYTKKRFQNPIRQNYKHIVTVLELLKDEIQKEHIFNVVVFEGELKTEQPAEVTNIKELKNHLSLLFKTPILSQEQISVCTEVIDDSKLSNNEETKELHINNLKKRFSTN